MPIRSYFCLACKDTNSPQEFTDLIEWGYELVEHLCPVCTKKMQVRITQIASPSPTGEALKARERKKRFQKRNKRILSKPAAVQEKFKKLIDRTGGQRYIP